MCQMLTALQSRKPPHPPARSATSVAPNPAVWADCGMTAVAVGLREALALGRAHVVKVGLQLQVHQALLYEGDQRARRHLVHTDWALVREALVAKRECRVREACACSSCISSGASALAQLAQRLATVSTEPPGVTRLFTPRYKYPTVSFCRTSRTQWLLLFGRRRNILACARSFVRIPRSSAANAIFVCWMHRTAECAPDSCRYRYTR